MRGVKQSLAMSALLLPFLACSSREEPSFRKVQSEIAGIKSSQGSDYEQLIKAQEDMEFKARSFLGEFSNSKHKDEMEAIRDTAQRRKETLKQELVAYRKLKQGVTEHYDLAGANQEIKSVNEFLSMYSESIKRAELHDRMESLTLVKFEIQTKSPPSTISAINRLIGVCNGYLTALRTDQARETVRSRIHDLEERRQDIVAVQLQSKTNELFGEMEDRAREVGREAHPASRVESVSVTAVSGDAHEAAGRKTIIRDYHVYMRGAILGITRHNLSVRVTGVIYGDPSQGVNYSAKVIAGVYLPNTSRSSLITSSSISDSSGSTTFKVTYRCTEKKNRFPGLRFNADERYSLVITASDRRTAEKKAERLIRELKGCEKAGHGSLDGSTVRAEEVR